MARISNSELALLSLIAEKPMHAYEIERTIEDRNIRDWTDLGFSSIYRHLSNMEGSGLISGELTPPVGRGPARKVYKLTPKGDSSINSAVLGILRSPQRNYSNFLLALDNLMRIQESQAVTALNENKSQLTKLINTFSKLIEHHPMNDNFYIIEFFGFITHQLESELDWLECFIDRYQSHIRNVNLITEQESNE